MNAEKSKLAELDFSNELDVLYAFRNIQRIPGIVDCLHRAVVKNIDFGGICFEAVENAVLNELGECFVDKEMLCMIEEITGAKKAPAGVSTDPQFHIKNLDKILKPLIAVCNKKIVDLVYYVYRRTGISHFDFLFDNFTVMAQKIELHLLVARGIKERPFDLTKIKECLTEAGKQKPSIEPFRLADSKEQIIPLPFLESEMNESSDAVVHLKENEIVFENHKHVSMEDQNYHLSKAKSMILAELCYMETSFVLDNLSAYLLLRFDRKIFECFMQNYKHPLFPTFLARLPSVPFFFYRTADIRIMLSSTGKIRKDPYNFGLNLKQPKLLKMNSCMLQNYLKFVEKTVFSLDTIGINYILVARGLQSFVRHYSSKALFKIFHELANTRIYEIQGEIKAILAPDLIMYLEMFLGDEKDTELVEPGGEAADDDPFGAFPSLSDNMDTLVNAYLNPDFYTKADSGISGEILRSFEEKYGMSKEDIRDSLEEFVQEISADHGQKIFVLNSLEKIQSFFSGRDKKTNAFEKVLKNLKTFDKMNWRYRKAFVENASVLKKYGVDKEWIVETLGNDKVFCVRKAVEKLN